MNKLVLVLPFVLACVACTKTQQTKFDDVVSKIECRAEALKPFDKVVSKAQASRMLSGEVDPVEVLQSIEAAPAAVAEFKAAWDKCNEEDPS